MDQIPIDDISEWLQCARFGELDSIVYIISEVYSSKKRELIFSIELNSGNTALHMAAANNHTSS